MALSIVDVVIAGLPFLSMLLFSLSMYLFTSNRFIKIISEIDEQISVFAAGMLLSCVINEIAPLLIFMTNDSQKNGKEEASQLYRLLLIAMQGAGILLAFLILNGIEGFVKTAIKYVNYARSPKESSSFANGLDSAKGYQSIDEVSDITSPSNSAKGYGLQLSELEACDRDGSSVASEESVASWEDDDIIASSRTNSTIFNPHQKAKVYKQVAEVLNSVNKMKAIANINISEISALDVTSNPNPTVQRNALTTRRFELISDRLDEEVHRLQYTIDRCRRLVQGAEISSTSAEISPQGEADGRTDSADGPAHPQDDPLGLAVKYKVLVRSIESLGVVSQRLVDYIKVDASPPSKGSSNIAKEIGVIKRFHKDIDLIDSILTSFHEEVEDFGFKWHRKKKVTLFHSADKARLVEVGLVLPVVVDCIVDGTIIGIALSYSWRAALVVSLANTLEMGVLGISYTIRVKKCGGSSELARLLSITLPPTLMLFASLVADSLFSYPKGADALGDSTVRDLCMTTFISFSMVALLQLILCELLPSNYKNTQSHNYLLFFGYYLVLLL